MTILNPNVVDVKYPPIITHSLAVWSLGKWYVVGYEWEVKWEVKCIARDWKWKIGQEIGKAMFQVREKQRIRRLGMSESISFFQALSHMSGCRETSRNGETDSSIWEHYLRCCPFSRLRYREPCLGICFSGITIISSPINECKKYTKKH